MDLNILNSFALRLYSLADADSNRSGNFIISPLSLWLLIANLAHGTDFVSQEDKEKVEYVLGVPLSDVPEMIRAINKLDNVETQNALHIRAADLTTAPYMKKWFDNKELYDFKSEDIPSKVELDAWVSDISKGLITSFPVSEDDLNYVSLLAMNILYSKLTWAEEFKSITNSSNKQWAADELLCCTAKQGVAEIDFYSVEEGLIASLRKKTENLQGEVISVTTIGETLLSNTELLGYAHAIGNNLLTKLNFDEIAEANNVKIVVKKSVGNDRIVAIHPAWEVESEFKADELLEQLGISAIEKAFRLGDMESKSTLSQAAVSKYNKYGFEGAALSSYAMCVGLLPAFNQVTEIELTFDRPFATLVVDSGAPVFAGIIKESSDVEK